MNESKKPIAYYHLPGLFEFYELYRAFLPLFREHREYFYDWCEIGSLYGAPADCLWGGGRVGFGDQDARAILALTREYGISARLTFSNSLLRSEHLTDSKCNALCRLFAESGKPQNGVIVHSELLLDFLKTRYPGLYFVSSTTKVLTDFERFAQETARDDFRFAAERAPAAAEGKSGISLQRMLLVRLPGQKSMLRGGQPQKPRRARPGASLQSARRGLRVSLLQSDDESGVYQRGRHSKCLPADGIFPFQNRGPQPWQRADSGVSALLHDETGIPAAGSGRNLSGKYARLILKRRFGVFSFFAATRAGQKSSYL